MSDQVFVLNIWDNREYCEDTTLYRTREGARMALAHYCRDFWRWPDPAPDSDDVTIEQYFTRRADYEGYSLDEQQVGHESYIVKLDSIRLAMRAADAQVPERNHSTFRKDC